MTGAITAIVFITAITIAADLYSPLKDWLKENFSHHWIGKGILAIAAFLLAGFLKFLFGKTTNEIKIAKNLAVLNWLSIIGSLAILGFFIFEAWK